MTILEMLLQTHTVLVEFFIFALLTIAVLPNFLKENMSKTVFWSRIGYFLFWAAWTMVSFSGLLVFAVKRGELSVSVTVMIIATAALAFLDSYRAFKLKKFWIAQKSGLKFSNMVLLLEIAIVVAVIILAITLK